MLDYRSYTDSCTMAAKLSLVWLGVLLCLSCSLGGRQRFRTEEERRNTRKKLAEQMDPRRARIGTANIGGVGDQETRRSSIKLSRKLFQDTLSNQDNNILRDLIHKRIEDDKHAKTNASTEQSDNNNQMIFNININSDKKDVSAENMETSDSDKKHQIVTQDEIPVS